MSVFTVVVLVFALLLVPWLVKGTWQSRKQKIPLTSLPDTFVVLDLETTGLDPAVSEIIEVAAIRYVKGSPDQEVYQALVKPEYAISNRIIEITGITRQLLDAEGLPLEQVIKELREFIGSSRIVTFNAKFDIAFLDSAALRVGLPLFHSQVSCALKMARKAWPRRSNFSLQELARDGQFAEGHSHRALEDARQALIVYVAAVAELGEVS
jgi:DNA polymerase III epsilon subunit family exonuclease